MRLLLPQLDMVCFACVFFIFSFCALVVPFAGCFFYCAKLRNNSKKYKKKRNDITKQKDRPSYGLREKKIADLYVKAIPLAPKSIDAMKLMKYKNPKHTGAKAGDFAIVLHDVLAQRCVQQGTKNIKQVNQDLEMLAKTSNQSVKIYIVFFVFFGFCVCVCVCVCFK